MKTGREWMLVESSKLQDRRQRNCVIHNVTVDSAELSDHINIVSRSNREDCCRYVDMSVTR